jgi:hypothetical protein
MSSSIELLSPEEQANLYNIARRLKQTFRPEFVFCFGIRHYQDVFNSCFTLKPKNRKLRFEFDLVLIISNDQKAGDRAIRAIASNLLQPWVKINLLVHRKMAVFTELEEGNFFFSWLFRNGLLLYSKGTNYRKINYRNDYPATKAFLYPESLVTVNKLQGHARSFLLSARNQLKAKDYATSLNLIRQSISSACNSLLLGCIGYSFFCNDIELTFNLTRNFTSDITDLFPRTTPQEARLHQLAITGIENGSSHHIALPNVFELKVLIQRVEHLLQVVGGVLSKSPTILQKPPSSINQSPFTKPNNHFHHESYSRPAPAGTLP